MDIVTLVKTASEFGILLLIAGIFLYFYIKDRNKKMEEDTKIDDLQKYMKEEMGKLSHGMPAITEKEKQEIMYIDNEINHLLKNLRKKTHAARAGLIRYHNGGKDLGGLAFLKLSITNEDVAPGYKPRMQELQNQFRSIFSYIVAELDEKDTVYIDNLEDLKDIDVGSYETIIAGGTKSIYFRRIKNSSGSTAGMIILSYMEPNIADLKLIDATLAEKQIKIETLLNIVKK